MLPPIFNKDTAGFAIIKEGDRRVRVDFDHAYVTTPVVSTSITFEATDNIDDVTAETLFNEGLTSIIVDKNESGFTILLNKNAPYNIRFSWVALGVRDPKVFESEVEGLIMNISKPTPESQPTLTPESTTSVEAPPGDVQTVPEQPAPAPEIIPAEPITAPGGTPPEAVAPEPAPSPEPIPETTPSAPEPASDSATP